MDVKLKRCPYDNTSIDVDEYSGGSYVISCPACGARWEQHNTLVRRVAPPDWEAVRRARAVNAEAERAGTE
jgi:hypothetical protein